MDVLATLRELQLLPAADVQEIAAEGLDFDRGLREATVHVDPQRPHQDGVTGLYVAEAYLNTEASPPYLRLPSFPELSPYLIVYFFGLPSAIQHTALVDMEVFSAGGSVRITATNNPSAVLVTHSGTGGERVTVPVRFTTTSDGFASLLLQRVDQTGFDWFGTDLF
jgi:hypothetical protein